MAAARASLNAGNYRGALTSAREVLALDPGNAAALRIRDQAAQMLARFDGEIADVRQRLANGDLEGAGRALERARSIDVTSPAVPELSARLADAFRAQASGAAASIPAPPVTPPPAPQPAPAAEKPQVPAPPVVTPEPVPPPKAPETKPEPPPAAAKDPAASERPVTIADEEAAIRQVIANYGRAIEGKDLRLFRSIKPNLTEEEERRLQEGFRAVTSQRVSLTIISIDRKGDRANALIRRRDEIEAGGRKQTADARQMVTLTRTPAGWVIVDIR
jgi:hypothetical protein